MFSTAGTTALTKKHKEDYVAKISLSGFTPTGKESWVQDFNAAMSHDTHVRAVAKEFRQVGGKIQYEMKIDVARQEGKKFNTKLVVIPQKEKIVMVQPQKKKGAPAVDPDDPPDPDPDPDPDGDPPMAADNREGGLR